MSMRALRKEIDYQGQGLEEAQYRDTVRSSLINSLKGASTVMAKIVDRLPNTYTFINQIVSKLPDTGAYTPTPPSEQGPTPSSGGGRP